jgi:hypothetical protein
MKHVLKVIFGKEQVAKIHNNEVLSDEELKLNVNEYQFETEIEKKAFIKGLNAAVGWTEFCIPELEIASGLEAKSPQPGEDFY